MGWKIKVKMPKIKLDNKSAGNWLKNVTGQISPLYAALGKKPPAPGDPGESPELTALREKLTGEAQGFRKDLGEMQGAASNSITKQGMNTLDTGIDHVNKGANDRGLLYSGMREKNEADLRGNVASTMAGQKSASNKELSNLADAKDMTAATVGMEAYKDSVNRASEIAAQNQSNAIARGQAMQAIGNAGGSALGAYYGAQSTPKTTTESTTAATGTGYGSYGQSPTPYRSPDVAMKGGSGYGDYTGFLGDKNSGDSAMQAALRQRNSA